VNKSLEEEKLKRSCKNEEGIEKSVNNTERLMKCRREVGEIMERNIASRKEGTIGTRAPNSIASLRKKLIF
jgi:hypothetical protein